MQSISFTDSIAVKEVIDAYKVVINKGLNQGIKKGDRFLIYNMGEEIIDPSTNKSYGRLEVTKGTGLAILVRDNETIIESDRKEKSIWDKVIETAKAHPEIAALAIPLLPVTASIALPAAVAVAAEIFKTEDVTKKDITALMPFNTPQVGDRVKHVDMS